MNTPGFRKVFSPRPSDEELAAIDAIRAAYMACNAAPGPLEYEVTPGSDHGYPATAMGFLAEAGRTAWVQVGIPEEFDLWDVMGDSGEGAAYCYGLYAKDLLVPNRPH